MIAIRTAPSWKLTPFLLDVPTDFIASPATRIVVPRRSHDAVPAPLDICNPLFEIDGKKVVIDTAARAALPRNALRAKVADVRGRQLAIDNARDFLFQGI